MRGTLPVLIDRVESRKTDKPVVLSVNGAERPAPARSVPTPAVVCETAARTCCPGGTP